MSEAQAIFDKMMEDPQMAAVLQAYDQKQIMAQFLETELLPAMVDLLDKPATAETIIQAQHRYASHSYRSGVARRLGENASAAVLEIFNSSSPKDLGELFAVIMEIAASQVESVVENFRGFLKQQGVTEEIILTTYPLTPGNRAGIAAGTLTIRDIMHSQPTIIIAPFTAD